MKKTGKLIAGVLVLGILGGSYVILKNHNEKTEEAEEDEIVEVAAISLEDINQLAFTLDDGDVIFKKENDVWQNQLDPDFPLNEDKITDITEQLSSIKADRVLEDIESLAEYGLDEPQNKIQIMNQSGEEQVIYVGNENQVTNQYYLQINDDKETVYVVASSVVTPFTGKLYDFAEADSLPVIDSTGVKDITVEKEENSYVLEASTDVSSGWMIGENKEEMEAADSGEAYTLISSISTLSYDDFVDYNCENMEDYGLEKPYAVLTVNYTETVENQEDNEQAADGTEMLESVDTENMDSGESINTEESDNIEDASGKEEGNDAEKENDIGEISPTQGAINTEESADAEESNDVKEVSSTDEVNDPQGASDIEDSVDVEEASNSEETDTVKESTNTEETSDVEEKKIDRQLILNIGDVCEGGRYVNRQGSKEVYVISEDNLSAIFDKQVSDFYDLTVSYVPIARLKQLTVIENGNETVIDAVEEIVESEEESEDVLEEASNEANTDTENEEPETEIVYYVGGTKLDSLDFKTFYSSAVNQAAQSRYEEKYEPEAQPEFILNFVKDDGTIVGVSYYAYDGSFYMAVRNDGRMYLVNKMNIKQLIESWKNVIEE